MIGPTVSVIGKQQVDEAIKELAARLGDEISVLVGVPAGAGKYQDGLTIATIAAVNEFGTEDGHIPPRPFLRPGVNAVAPALNRLAERDLPDILEGKQPMSRLLHRMGNLAVGSVKKWITDLDTPPNAASTIRKKGSSHPLIDAGALRQSINYDVVDNREPIEEGL